jgi:hypothetical protein
MSDSAAKITAAPIPMQFGGETYYMSPMRDGDYGEFEAWIQDRYLSLAKRNLDGLEPPDRETLLKAALEKAGSLTIYSPEAIQVMVSVDGAAKLIWLSLRHRHPEIAEERVKGWVSDPVVMREALDKHDELNRPPPSPKAGGVPAGARSQRRRDHRRNRRRRKDGRRA